MSLRIRSADQYSNARDIEKVVDVDRVESIRVNCW